MSEYSATTPSLAQRFAAALAGWRSGKGDQDWASAGRVTAETLLCARDMAHGIYNLLARVRSDAFSNEQRLQIRLANQVGGLLMRADPQAYLQGRITGHDLPSGDIEFESWLDDLRAMDPGAHSRERDRLVREREAIFAIHFLAALLEGVAVPHAVTAGNES